MADPITIGLFVVAGVVTGAEVIYNKYFASNEEKEEIIKKTKADKKLIETEIISLKENFSKLQDDSKALIANKDSTDKEKSELQSKIDAITTTLSEKEAENIKLQAELKTLKDETA